ncbi:sigma factor-like helix-turn-helix DNA-binding protein [Faecalibaculum rodentium]|uniref:sigma factor-like helix-turn-helix DNA-binding protein n=1 Tax=Faecalibaculum rodentium TaxID=1702221 RepID=UPI0034E44E47
MYEAVCILPRKYRVALQLHYSEDFSIRETAQLTGQTESAVKTQLSRGRVLLRALLKGEQEQ